MKLSSPAFGHQESIPSKYTCDGANVSPPLQISGVPPDARSLALVVDDPDAPGRTFVHWVVYNIPVSVAEVPENSAPGTTGTNHYRKLSYGGPCPPSGRHRYFFKLYALDKALDLPPGRTKAELEQAMLGHVLEQTELIGLYARR